MLPFLQKIISYRSSFLFVLLGLFLIIYPIIGISKDDLFLTFRPGAKGTHLHGADAAIMGVGLLLIGTSALLRGIKNILEERQRDQNLYAKKAYPRLAKTLTWSRDLGVVILILFSLVKMALGFFNWLT